MITVVNETGQVDVPPWVSDLDAFRRWTNLEDFPDDGRICYLKGNVWVDMSREQIAPPRFARTMCFCDRPTGRLEFANTGSWMHARLH